MPRNKLTANLDFQISRNNESNQNKKRLREERTIAHLGQKCSTSPPHHCPHPSPQINTYTGVERGI